MEHICEYCKGYVKDSEDSCPTCGAPNPNYGRSANGIPQTIEELKQYAAQHNLPLKKMRFFIGEDYKGAKAFGIFERDGVYTVYKNKADGTRAVRYEGRDEAYAVNELYQKMHAEVMARKAAMPRRQQPVNQTASRQPDQNPQQTGNVRKTANGCTCFLGAVMTVLVLVPLVAFLFRGALPDFFSTRSSPTTGYYYYDDDYYYYSDNNWYEYDDGWRRVSPRSDLADNWDDYYYGYNYNNSMGAEDFSETSYYYDDYSQNDDYDNDYDNDYDDNDTDWDNGWDDDDTWDTGTDWDTGTTDWDSDW